MKQNNPTFTIIANLIATGLSPNNPDLSQFNAGKLMLSMIKKCIKNRQDFAIETTLSSKNYLKIIKRRYNRSIDHLVNNYFDIIDNITCLNNENDSEIIFEKSEKGVIINNRAVYSNILEYKKC